MKTITKFLMPLKAWLFLWYKPYFINPEGIKAFAVLVMNWLLQNTMSLAERLKKQNKKMAETIRTQKALLAKLYKHPIVEADEWDEIKGTIRKLNFWVILGVLGEAALNYFGISVAMTRTGLFWVGFKMMLALVLTGLFIYPFHMWFAYALNTPKYKQVEPQPRKWLHLGVVTLICVLYEGVIYYLCKVRGFAIEGGSDNGVITNFVMLAGMLLPAVAGFLSYEWSYYISPYRNTLRINKAERLVAKLERDTAINNQRMEDNFKREVENKWALLQEFKLYKDNYNAKHDIKEESIAGHFAETYQSFGREAVERYTKEVLHRSPIEPTIVFAPEQKNGHTQEAAQVFN